jgi:hypothetical protein
MRYLMLSFGMNVALGLVGLALAWREHPYVAAIFFIAAGTGLAADGLTVIKAYRAKRSGPR